MKRALVTGIEGFTGRHLVPELNASGYDVHGLAQTTPAAAVEGIAELHTADLTDAAALADVVERVRPHAVVHLAGISFVVGPADGMYQVNLIGTLKLLTALAALTVAPGAVLLASSANVYGNATEGTLDEDTPPAPANDYAVRKLAMEHMARLFAPRLPVILCRPFNYTGVGQSDAFLLPKIVSHLRRGEERIELGNLDVARDFSDVRDVVRIYRQLIEAPGAVGQTVNVCSGQARTLREVLALAQSIAGRTIDVRVNPAFVRANDVRVLLGSRRRLASLMELADPLPLEDTLRWMLEAPGGR